MKPKAPSLAVAFSVQRNNRRKMAKGGMAMPAPSASNDADEHYDSIADAIMAKKRKAKMMAEGGMVDIDENAEETSANPSPFDEQNEEAAMKENLDSDMDDVSQPMDSNEHGDILEDEDSHDMVASIRKKMRAKRGL